MALTLYEQGTKTTKKEKKNKKKNKGMMNEHT